MIAILDFGSQYNQLIARRVRECRVYCEILDHDITPARLKARKVQGIILSGGPASIFDKGVPKCDAGIFELGVPVLGICYGAQLMAYTMGGKVTASAASRIRARGAPAQRHGESTPCCLRVSRAASGSG